jgi:inward rectifier potassium channel
MTMRRTRPRSAAGREGWGRTTRPLLIGGYETRMKGIARFDRRDPYYIAVALSWPQFLASLVALYTAINVGFALLYLAQPGAITNARPGSLTDAFFFSLEAASTVGYGEMYPATLFGHVVAGAEILVGMAFTALMTGLLFVRFSRPKARIRYAANAVVASHDGQPTLMIRIGNARPSLISDAGAHLVLLRATPGAGGQGRREVHELHLVRSRLPLFGLTWTLMHEVNSASPLHGYDAPRLVADDVHLVLSIEGRDVTLATTIVDMKAYGPTDILFGMRYAGAVSVDADGHPIANLTELSEVERDTVPEPPQGGWVNAH